MPETASTQITVLLQAIGGSDDAAAHGKLVSAVYEELRAMARQRLRGERAGHTLQTTALVHEAYLKLIGPGPGPGAGSKTAPGSTANSSPVPWQHRAHFFAACANAMRQILVEHARARNAHKRGGGVRPEVLDD